MLGDILIVRKCAVSVNTKFENAPKAQAVYNYKSTKEIFCRTNAATECISDFCKEDHNLGWHAGLYTFFLQRIPEDDTLVPKRVGDDKKGER